MAKSPELESFLEKFAKKNFGRSRQNACCILCGSKKVAPQDFRDALSRKEWTLSKMCQVCQDATFTSEPEEYDEEYSLDKKGGDR